MPNVLQLRHLNVYLTIESKNYKVVDDLSFDLKKGKTLALVGESGCGKTMTALSILRILPEPPALPPQGEIIFRGNNLITLEESKMCQIRGRHIAMIFQDPLSALNPVYSIGEQLKEVIITHLGDRGEAVEKRAIQALKDVHLPNPKECMRQYPHQMSGGMLQRVTIAMALLCSPDVLIADEPTTALDVSIQAQILSLLKELQEKKEMAILLITHDMGIVSEMADEVIVMYAGENIEQAAIKELIDNPAHPYTQALFAARPSSILRGGKLPTISGTVPRITDLPQGCRFHPRCRYEMKMCSHGKVPVFPLLKGKHNAKCWLYDKNLEFKLTNETTSDS